MGLIPEGVALVKAFEGLHRVVGPGMVQAYLCPNSVWTIGWGTTGKDIKPGLAITVNKANEYLTRDLNYAMNRVLVLSPILALHPVKLAAVTSFAYNLGVGAYQVSTLRRRINAGQWDEAAAQFGRWVFAGQKLLKGLVLRREAERALFCQTGTPSRSGFGGGEVQISSVTAAGGAGRYSFGIRAAAIQERA